MEISTKPVGYVEGEYAYGAQEEASNSGHLLTDDGGDPANAGNRSDNNDGRRRDGEDATK